MSGYSNVGGRGVYEAGDQRNVKDADLQTADRYNEGNTHAHSNLDSSMEPSQRHQIPQPV
jgi:alpha-D-ribose 1-methylphosphonate 5-triphosphate synthase subunit PhnG